MNEPRGFGCIPDLPDSRDRRMGFSGIGRPQHVNLRHPAVIAKDQSWTNSCTGQAIAQAVRTVLLNAGIDCPELSAPDNYFNGRAEWGGELADTGSYLRTGIKALNRLGICPEAKWPFDPDTINQCPPWSARRAGWDIKFTVDYYRIFDAAGVCDAISIGDAVVGGWAVDSAFGDAFGPDVIEQMGPQAGLHALMAEGYDDADQTCTMLNSYGQDYRQDGRVRFKYTIVDDGFDKWGLRVRLQ